MIFTKGSISFEFLYYFCALYEKSAGFHKEEINVRKYYGKAGGRQWRK